MAVVRNITGTYNELTEGFEAAVDLSSHQYCAVGASGAATGKVQAGLVSGQGTLALGILQNASATAGKTADVMTEGLTKAKAYETFNSGVELTPHDTTGRLESAASGDYVVALAREASTCANAIVIVKLVNPYQKN